MCELTNRDFDRPESAIQGIYPVSEALLYPIKAFHDARFHAVRGHENRPNQSRPYQKDSPDDRQKPDQLLAHGAPQRASAPARAISDRRAGVSFFARACPPARRAGTLLGDCPGWSSSVISPVAILMT